MKNLLTTTFIFAGLVANAQLSYCGLDWTYTMQNLSGVFTWTNTGTGCPPVADQAIPFPTGTAGPLVGYTNVQTPGGDGYPGDIAPLGDQPDVYVVCGKDLFNESIADFSIGNIGATEFGGLHVGWTTPAGSFGSDLNIYCTDSLLLKELWVVEGATVNIQGPVFITKECHNAGTINIEEGGSLTFLVDKELHQSSTFENLGQVNGEISYETILFSHPSTNTPEIFLGSLPQSLQDSLLLVLSGMSPSEIAEFFADGEYLTNTEDLAPNLFTAYHTVGVPVKGVKFNPWDGDIKAKHRFKGFNNNAGHVVWQGQVENLYASANWDGSMVGMMYVDSAGNINPNGQLVTDTLFFDFGDGTPTTIDTSLVNNGFFQELSFYYSPELIEEDHNLFDNATALSWVPFLEENNGFIRIGPPDWLAAPLFNLDHRWLDANHDQSWENSNKLFISDSLAPNWFGLVPGELYPHEFPEELSYPSTARSFHNMNEQQYGRYFRFAFHDAETPLNNINVCAREIISYSEFTPTIREYTGTPWANSSEDPLTVYFGSNYNLGYYYNPDGELFSLTEFNDCLVDNDTAYCYDYTGDVQTYDVGTTSQIEFQSPNSNPYWNPGPELNPYSHNYSKYSVFLNPLNGYLDLDLVAAAYFEQNPETNHVEFIWYSGMGPAFQATQAINPASVAAFRQCWLRRYYKYADNIYNNEYSFWIQTLIDNVAANPGVQNDLITAFVSDWQDDNLFNSGIVANYLQESVITPFHYIQLGRYVMPGAALFTGTGANTHTEVVITPDMAVYDFEFPQTVNAYDIVGDYNIYSGNRSGPLDSASATTVMTIDYVNDTTFMPSLFFYHQFAEGATNGTGTTNEDNEALSGKWPYLAGDSAEFYPATFAQEALPHNDNPLLAVVNEPENGDWAIIPITFQENTQDLLPDPPFERLGFRIADSNGNYGIKYLQENDTLWFRQDAYAYPVSVEVLFTNLIGDVTGDGYVTSADITDFLQNYGECETDVPAINDIQDYDFNGNGCVDVGDYLLLHQNYQHHLYVDDRFEPIQYSENPIDANIVTSNYTDLETEPDVSLSGLRLTMAPGERVELYNLQFDLIGTSGGGIDLPNTDLFIIITDRRVGYVDARLP